MLDLDEFWNKNKKYMITLFYSLYNNRTLDMEGKSLGSCDQRNHEYTIPQLDGQALGDMHHSIVWGIDSKHPRAIEIQRERQQSHSTTKWSITL